jgi:hypothetical protein
MIEFVIYLTLLLIIVLNDCISGIVKFCCFILVCYTIFKKDTIIVGGYDKKRRNAKIYKIIRNETFNMSESGKCEDTREHTEFVYDGDTKW